MAKIPLRAYVKEIENLIERGEIEQAVAHARNILKSYPKHIETYRLLGKAYLESQRYAEAADILQRVLSVFPDDFVSQIGMSIIREDENNLDAAIWHMERAYEVQPFNPAVQDELRRLYGRRDGVEPPKIRLTRGALVRMYTRGELYPQAIAETRAALAEDPQRLDLQVLLARLYFLSNQKVEAAEVCSALLSKLPYCYDANHILAEVLPGTNRADDARKFQQRIYAMEPYAAFISPTAPSIEQVPDQSVMVERFIWDPTASAGQSPDWARTAGVQWEEEQSQPEEDLPDWLGQLKPEASARPTAGYDTQPGDSAISSDELSGLFAADAAEQAPDQTTETPPSAADDLVPDWMKEAGWAKTDRSADEIAKEQLQRDAELELAGDAAAETGEAEQGDIPDWLKSMAPPQETPEEEQRDEWLSSILEEPPGAPAAEPPAPEASMGEQLGETEQPSDMPDWLAGLDEASAAAGTAAAASAIPDWLSGGDEQQAEQNKAVDDLEWEQATSAYAANQTSMDDTPDWLRDLDRDSVEPAARDEVAAASAAGAEPTGAADDSIDDWMQSFQQGPAAEAAPASEQDDTPAWLRSFGGEEPEAPQAPAEEPWMQAAGGESETETAPADLPEWLLSDEPQASGAAISPAASEPGADEETPTGSTPEWLQSIEANEAIRSDETGPTRVSTDWLKSFESDETRPTEGTGEELPAAESTPDVDWMSAIEGTPGGAEEAPEKAEIPDWLQSLDPSGQPSATADTGLTAGPSPELPGTEAAEQAEVTPDFSDMDSAMAWLESLAAKHGADEETLVTPPEQRLDTPPDWVQKAAAEAGAEPVGQSIPAVDAQIPEEPAQQALAGDAPEAALPAEEVPPTFETQQPPAPEPAQAEQPAPDFADMDEAMAWLESLAAKHGADEQTLVTPPEQRLETPPEWVQKASEEDVSEFVAPPGAAESEPALGAYNELAESQADETAAAETSPLAAEAADLPDWLKDMQEDQAPSAAATAAETAANAAADAEANVDESAGAQADTELPDWLAGAFDETQPVSTTKPELTSQPEPPAAEQGEPAEAVSDQTGQPLPPAEPSTPELSDMDAAMAWLESLAAKHGADEQTLVTPPEQRLEAPPDWVARESAEEAASPAEELPQPTFDTQRSPDFPDWLEQAGPQEAEAQADVQEQPAQEAPSPDFSMAEQAPEEPRAEAAPWEDQLAAPTPAVEQPAAQAGEAAGDMPDFSDMDSAMAWLESLAAKHGADEQTLVTPPEQRLETPPDWVQKAVEDGERAAEEADMPASSLPAAEQADELTLDETADQQPNAAEAVEPPAVAELRQEEENLPDWLKDMVELENPQASEGTDAGSEPAAAGSATQAEEAEAPTKPSASWAAEPPTTETPEAGFAWLEEETAGNLFAEQAEQMDQAGQAAAEVPGVEDDLDADFAWLESLAAKQGAQEGTLITTPEDRVETPPDWVRESAEDGPTAQAEETPSGESEGPGVEWTGRQVPPPAETMFDLEAEEEVEEPAAPPSAPSSSMWQFEEQPAPEQEDLPDWLRQPEASQAQPTADQQEAVPDWLKNIEDEADQDLYTGSVFPGETIEAGQQANLPADYPPAWGTEATEQPRMDDSLSQPPAYPGGVPTTLEAAQSALLHGQVENALEYYTGVIENGEQLEETIHDLRDALYRYPVDISIWQALGDAYARNNQLQEALDAYTKAEELLR